MNISERRKDLIIRFRVLNSDSYRHVGSMECDTLLLVTGGLVMLWFQFDKVDSAKLNDSILKVLWFRVTVEYRL